MQQEHKAAGKAGPTALTIAGFDPTSGAGITADLLVFAAHGVFATSAITALTAQSTLGVRRVQAVAPALLAETLRCLEEDLPPAGIKIGMLASEHHVGVVVEYLRSVRSRRQVAVVLDPVLRSSSGADLLNEAGQRAMLADLLPLVDVITPNLAEAEVLTGQSCRDEAQMVEIAATLRAPFPKLAVVITGGHLAHPRDLFVNDDGVAWLDGEHVPTTATHGTGCAFSTALLAQRLCGESWLQSARLAKEYVAKALATATERGGGHGPMNLLDRLPG